MNQASVFPNLPPVPSLSSADLLNDVIREHSRKLTEQIAKQRLAAFPPSSAKTFRRLSPSEVCQILDVSDDYLRQIAATVCPLVPGQTRRTYNLEDLGALRQAMAERSRTPHKFLRHRQKTETAQIISIMNFKGGSGKTTTSINLTQYLAIHGYRTLAIDLDPQASLTTLFGLAPETAVGENQTLYGAIRPDGDRAPISSVIRKTYIPGLDLIPAGIELMEFEHSAPRDKSETVTFLSRISDALPAIVDDYDVIVIDCPPQLGFLSLAALVASTSLLITVHSQMLDVLSMAQFLTMLADILDVIAKVPNAPKNSMMFDWHRYLITRFEPTDGPQHQMALFLRAMFGGYVLNNPTLKSTAISDAGLTSQTIYEVERSQFTRATYDRAIESVNAVNEEIVGLIRNAWGRT